MKTIRDWLFAFSTCEDIKAFDLFSSNDVLAEAMYHIRRNNPTISGKKINAILDQMTEIVELVDDFDCEAALPAYKGSDENDLHLHAAACDSHSDVLLTNDRKLYKRLSDEELDELPYSVYTADDFFCLLAESPVLLDQAVSCELDYWSHRCEEGVDLRGPLVKAECPNFAYLVERALKRKSGLSPISIDELLPLDERYSAALRANSRNDLAVITDDFC